MSGIRNETEIASAKEIHFQALCAPNIMLMNVHRVKNQGPIVQMSKVKVNPSQGISCFMKIIIIRSRSHPLQLTLSNAKQKR